jgi:hypothetical protein
MYFLPLDSYHTTINLKFRHINLPEESDETPF